MLSLFFFLSCFAFRTSVRACVCVFLYMTTATADVAADASDTRSNQDRSELIPLRSHRVPTAGSRRQLRRPLPKEVDSIFSDFSTGSNADGFVDTADFSLPPFETLDEAISVVQPTLQAEKVLVLLNNEASRVTLRNFLSVCALFVSCIGFLL